MMLSEPVRRHLLRLIRMGLDAGVGRLAQLSGAVWEVSEINLREGKADELRQAKPAQDPGHCGAFFQMPGGVFLLAFPDASVTAVAKAFVKGFSRKGDGWAGKDADVMAEVSNMVVNPVVNVLGDAALMIVFLSSPQVQRAGGAQLDAMAFDRLVLREDKGVLHADIRLRSEGLSSQCRLLMIFNSALAEILAECLGD